MKNAFITAAFLSFFVRPAAGQQWQATTAPTNIWTGIACSSNATKLAATAWFGRIYLSTDSGASWTPRDSVRQWQAVASSADGEKLVAVVDGGGSRIYTSSNSGVDWTPRGPTNLNWSCVASSADGTRLAAGAVNGQLYTSHDSGATWVPREFSRNWASVASSHDGSKLVAAVGAGQIYTSVNFGTNWTARENNRAWLSVASSANGSNIIAGAFSVLDTLPGRLCVSTNAGVAWTSYETNRDWWCVGSSAAGQKLIGGVRVGQLYLSADLGATWTATAHTDRWTSVACSWDGSKLIAASDNTTGNGTGKIFVSPPLPPAPPPSLAIAATLTNTVLVTWPSSATNWNLLQNTNLNETNWASPAEVIANDGSNKFIVVNPPLGNRFYRLVQP